MIKNISELAKFVKGGADVLQKAIDSTDEMSIEFVDGSFVSNEDLETLKTTVKADGQKVGQTIGYDFAMKDLKADFGIEVEGKDRKVIAEAIKSKIMAEAKIPTDSKIKELSESLSNLQTKYQKDIEVKDLEVQGYQKKVKDIKINSDLQMLVPEGLTAIKPDQFAVLARTNYTFDYDETGRLVAKKGDQVIKDKMENPLSVKEILSDFATQNDWIDISGRGGGNKGGGGGGEFKTIYDVFKHLEERKIDPMSSEGQKLIDTFNSKK